MDDEAERKAREARAEHRRQTWTGGKASSFAEMEEIDLDWWLAVPANERLAMVFDMWPEQACLQGVNWDEAAVRLQRAVGGVRTRGR